MLISLPDCSTKNLAALFAKREAAAQVYFAHAIPGNLTPAEKKAFHLENFALQLMLEAAQTRFAAELEMQELLEVEAQHG